MSLTGSGDQSNPATLVVNDLGRMGYVRALELQRSVNRAVSQGQADATLLLVEHDPVVTVSHRTGTWDHLLATPAQLDELGIDVQITDRGGDVTYHGPGQLVAYPILKLNPLGLNLGSYMRLLEQVVIDLLQDLGVAGVRDPDATGVWVQRSDHGLEPGLAKLCSLGVRVRKNTTMHGLALNVTTDLTHFKTIDPCGLGGRPVTSLCELLGEATPMMDRVKTGLVKQMGRVVETAWVGHRDG